MKKSLVCLLLTMCFALSLFIAPTAAFATEEAPPEIIEAEIAETFAKEGQVEIIEQPAEEQFAEPIPEEPDPEEPNFVVLEVGKRLELNPEFQNIEFTPTETGDYQLYFERVPGEEFCFLIYSFTSPAPVVMGGSKNDNQYGNIHMKAGVRYGFATIFYQAVTLTKESVDEIFLGEEIAGKPDYSQQLNLFIPKERGRYTFTRKGFLDQPEFQSFVVGINSLGVDYGVFDSKDSWSLLLEAGERCYISSRNARSIKVESENFQPISQNIERAYLLEDPAWFPWNGSYNKGNEIAEFMIDNKKANLKAYSKLKKPWLAIVPKAETGIPILKDSNGKVIEWQIKELASYGSIVYMAPISTNGDKRSYSLSMLQEDGDESIAKNYKLYVNPELKKPAAPQIINCALKNENPKIEWKQTTGTTGYYVYRSNSKTGEYKKIATLDNASITSFVDKSANLGSKPFYKVVSYVSGVGKTLRSGSSRAVRCK